MAQKLGGRYTPVWQSAGATKWYCVKNVCNSDKYFSISTNMNLNTHYDLEKILPFSSELIMGTL